VKSPSLCGTLGDVLASGNIVIDHALIPVRDLNAATASRIRVGGTNGSVPGGILNTSNPAHQKAVLAEMFHQLALTLATHQIPHTFLVFPRFVQDAKYAFEALHSVLGNINQTKFVEAFLRVAEPALVHTFDATSPTPRADTEAFKTAQQHKRLRRRVRRLFAWSAVAASLALNLYTFWPKTAPTENLSRQVTSESRVAAGVPRSRSLRFNVPSSIPLKFSSPVQVSAIWMQTPSLSGTGVRPPTGINFMQETATPIAPEQESALSEHLVPSVLMTGSE